MVKTVIVWLFTLAIVYFHNSAAQSIQWFDCNLYTNAVTNTKVQCAHVPVPLNYDMKNSKSIRIFVKRKSSNQRKVLWLLSGGSCEHFEESIELLSKQLKEFDIYTIDYRGTGRSERLTCIQSQAETKGSEGGVQITLQEWKSCAKEADSNFTSINAARDVLSLMNLVQQHDNVTEQYIYSFSYGSLLTTRIMQINDSLVSGLFMDGIVSTQDQRFTFDGLDATSNQVGLYLLSYYCKQDKTCSDKLHHDPIAFINSVFDKVENNCVPKLCTSLEGSSTRPVKVTLSDIRKLLYRFLSDRERRQLIPSILYRLERCDVIQDLRVLQHLFNANVSTCDTCEPLSSPLLEKNIEFSELYSIPAPSFHDLYTTFNKSFFAQGIYQYAPIRSLWPTYTPLYFNKTFTTNKPVVLINGDLDPITLDNYAKEQFRNIIQTTNQKQLIIVPYAPHDVLHHSPTINSDLTCGMQLLIQFVNDPFTKLVDHSCLQQLVPINFTGSASLVKELLGINDGDAFEGIFYDEKEIPTISIYMVCLRKKNYND